jgi:hypothetical protein
MPGFSFRNGRTTIYGGSPAVCATEMPLYSFARYVLSRGDEGKVSAYGIAFLKSEFYAAGGRPVIYGLSTGTPRFIKDTSSVRVFDDSVLPTSEQYRYVAYNPTGSSKWVDWSHEREWRWISQNERTDEVWASDYTGALGPTAALPIFKGRLDGRPFTQVCIIVWTHDEADEINELLTGFYLAGSNNYDTPFDRNLIEASKIIVLQDVVDLVEKGKELDAQTIEGLDEANLLTSITITATPKNADAVVKKAMQRAGVAAKAAVESFMDKHGHTAGYCGFAHAVTYEVTNPIVQYLLEIDQASGPFDGQVWIKYPKDFPPSQAMDYNEAGCRAAAEILSKDLGIKVYCETHPD